jgi:hypothetical protein
LRLAPYFDFVSAAFAEHHELHFEEFADLLHGLFAVVADFLHQLKLGFLIIYPFRKPAQCSLSKDFPQWQENISNKIKNFIFIKD